MGSMVAHIQLLLKFNSAQAELGEFDIYPIVTESSQSAGTETVTQYRLKMVHTENVKLVQKYRMLSSC